VGFVCLLCGCFFFFLILTVLYFFPLCFGCPAIAVVLVIVGRDMGRGAVEVA
jgi:hypothetical protein